MSISAKNLTAPRVNLKMSPQEPITRRMQLPHIPVAAFSQTDLFLV